MVTFGEARFGPLADVETACGSEDATTERSNSDNASIDSAHIDNGGNDDENSHPEHYELPEEPRK